MRLTGEHAEFYRQRKTPMPGWAQRFLPRARVSIDTCIAHHAGVSRDTDAIRETGNLMVIVRMVAKRLSRMDATPEHKTWLLCEELRRMSRERHNSVKRKGVALKWAKRIEHERERHNKV
jgi:hypothetical protein